MSERIDHTFQLASKYFRGKYQIETIERHWDAIVRILRKQRGF